MKILLLTTIFGVVAGQTVQTVESGGPSPGGFFPVECKEIIYINGTNSEYPLTSKAGVFSMFCPIVNEFVDCLEDNLDLIRGSNSSLYKLLADNFNSTVIRDRISDLCSRLQEVAGDLECIWNVTDTVQHCSVENPELVFKPGLTLDELCSEMKEISDCFTIAEGTNRCSRHVVEIHRSFIYLFMPPDCQIPTYPPTTTSLSPITTGHSSVIIACADETYPEIVKKIYQELSTGQSIQANIFKYIFEAVEDICRDRSKFAACIKDRFKPPFMKLDDIIDKLLTDNSIGTALDQYCSLELSKQEEKCLQESTSGMLICSSIIYGMFRRTQIAVRYSLWQLTFKTTLPETGNTNPDYVKYLCPAMNVANQCIGIHLERCSATLGQTFINVNKQAFTPECQASELTKENLASPVTSVLVLCGIPFAGQIQLEFLSFNQSNSKQHALDIMRDLIPTGCGFVELYTTCITKRLRNSQNIFDGIFTRMLDLADASRLQKLLGAVCDVTKEIQQNFNCLVEVILNSFGSCIKDPEYQTALKKFNFNDIDLNTVTDTCKPIKEIGLCAGNLISSCNKDLGRLAKDFVLELLRIDCGGARPLSSDSAKNMLSLIIAAFLLMTALFIV